MLVTPHTAKTLYPLFLRSEVLATIMTTVASASVLCHLVIVALLFWHAQIA